MNRIIQHKWGVTDRFADDSPMWHYVDNPVDLVFADPPYNYGVNYSGDDTGDKIPTLDYRMRVDYVLCQLSNLVKNGGTLWWLCPAEDGDWTWKLLTRHGSLLHGRPIIWYERFSQYQKKRLTSDYRLLFPLVVGQEKCSVFNPDDIRVKSVRQEVGDKRADPNGRVPGHVWTVRRLQGNARDRVKWHPTQLPPEPLEQIVRGWTNPGDTVMDAFAGSGSMGVVTKRLGRHFVGTEGSATYCEKIRRRLNAE